MATAPAASALLSIDEYLRTSYSPDVDFVDGQIEERNLGEYEHAKIQTLIAVIFNLHERAWATNTIVEQRLRVSPHRIRICDIAVLRADAPRESVTQTPPLLCIEVLSPEDRLSRAQKVLADYLAMGVEHLWLIDPLRRVAYTFDSKGLHFADPAHLMVPNTPVLLDLTDAFAALD